MNRAGARGLCHGMRGPTESGTGMNCGIGVESGTGMNWAQFMPVPEFMPVPDSPDSTPDPSLIQPTEK
ncbi:MAG: hypothetical protein RLY72_1883 [Planctomycetota bacterium]